MHQLLSDSAAYLSIVTLACFYAGVRRYIDVRKEHRLIGWPRVDALLSGVVMLASLFVVQAWVYLRSRPYLDKLLEPWGDAIYVFGRLMLVTSLLMMAWSWVSAGQRGYRDWWRLVTVSAITGTIIVLLT